MTSLLLAAILTMVVGWATAEEITGHLFNTVTRNTLGAIAMFGAYLLAGATLLSASIWASAMFLVFMLIDNRQDILNVIKKTNS